MVIVDDTFIVLYICMDFNDEEIYIYKNDL